MSVNCKVFPSFGKLLTFFLKKSLSLQGAKGKAPPQVLMPACQIITGMEGPGTLSPLPALEMHPSTQGQHRVSVS